MLAENAKETTIEAEISTDKLLEAIYQKSIELSEIQFNPEKYENFKAALNAGCLDNQKLKIEALMKQRDYANLGLCIMNAIVAELEEWSYEEAAYLYNSSLGGGDNE
jgi:hypothetical protein